MKQQPKLLSEQPAYGMPNYVEREYLVSLKETDDKIVERTRTVISWDGTGEMDEYYGKERSYTQTSTHQKFLCVNGPLKNTKVTEEVGNQNGYSLYNNANSRQKVPTPKVILVLFTD